MALFNITNKKSDNTPLEDKNFMSSNEQIKISVREPLRISELQITEQQWLGNF